MTNKIVFILRGVPGSGKSTYVANKVKELDAKFPVQIDIVSADHWFEKCGNVDYHKDNIGPMGQPDWKIPCNMECFLFDKIYVFDKSQLHNAHTECKQRFLYLIDHTDPGFIFVDNTNTTVEEMKWYVQCCNEKGFQFFIVNVRCDINVAAARNIHGVPLEKIKQMDRRIRNNDKTIPKDWPQIEFKSG